MDSTRHRILDYIAPRLWYVAIAGIAVAIYAALVYLTLPLELITLIVVVVLATMYLGGLPAFRLVFAVILIAIIINAANYTFFSFSAEGTRVARSSEARLFVMLRLPLLLFASVVVMIRYGAYYLRFIRSNWDVFVFSTIPFASILFSVDKVAAVQYSVWFFLAIQTILAFCFVLGREKNEDEWPEWIAWLLLLGYVYVVVFAGMSLRGYGGQGVLTPAYADSNIHSKACIVVVAAILVLIRVRGTSSASKWLRRVPTLVFVALGALAVITLLLGAKRAPIIGVGLTVLLYTLSGTMATGASRRRPFFRTLLVVIPLLVLTWQILPGAETTISRFERTRDLSQDNSMQERFEIWRNSMSIFSENIAFGVGLDNGRKATAIVVPGSAVAGYGLHNTYLAVLVEMGVIGAILFLVVSLRSLALFAKGCSPATRWTILLLAAGPLLTALVEYVLTPGQFLFWPVWMSILLPRLALVDPEPAAAHWHARPLR